MVNDQLEAQVFSMYLFQFSTCFEQHRAHHQENQLYQYNLWYMSLCVSDRFLSDLHTIHSINTLSGICHSVSVTVSCAGRRFPFRPAQETVTDTE